MALDSIREGNVVTSLANTVELPKMVKVQQIFDHRHYEPDEIPQVVRQQLEDSGIASRIKPGMSIAITCGSRGVANIALVIKAIVDFVKSCSGEPFVFPAMGSHGGATAAGQREILHCYGVTEEFIGCPIKATMDTVQIGALQSGKMIFTDKYAYEADGVILCNRVKAHTAFRGPWESGLLKMSVIGMGKQHGAEQVHEDGFSELGTLLPQIARVVFDNTKIIGGVALGENAFDQTYLVEAIDRDRIFEREPEILKSTKANMGKIYFNDIDVLVVDRIGKDISGDGMDPNITGRFAVPYIHEGINVQRIVVLDLTDESHGNCNGLGLADVTTKRAVDKVDVDNTYPNIVTSTVLNTAKIPMFTHSDESAIKIALRTCNYIDRANPRIVRIRDTRDVEEIYISESMKEEAEKNQNIKVLSDAEEWNFNSSGDLF